MKSRAQSQNLFPINFQDVVQEKDWDIRMCLSSCQRGASFHSSPNSFPWAEADSATQGLFHLFFIEQCNKWFYLPKQESNKRQIKDSVSFLWFVFFLVLHYYSRIIFILIVVIFYFKNLKSGSVSVHWTLVSDTNFKAMRKVQWKMSAISACWESQHRSLSGTAPVTWGKWPVIVNASPAGGKKENPKPALQWSSVGKGNGEKILPSYISRSPGKQRTTLCLKWGSLNKSWLSQ